MILSILVIAIGAWICAGLVQYALAYLNSYRLLLRSKCFHGPRAFPFIGSAYLFAGTVSDIGGTIKMLMSAYRSPFRVWLGSRLLFFMHDPEHIKRIFTSPDAIEKDRIYDVLKPWVGEGLISATGANHMKLFMGMVNNVLLATKWKPHRKVIQPLFSTKILESFIQTFTSKAFITAEKMGIEEPGKEFDVYKYMACYSFDSICETAMGVCFNSISNNDCTYLHCVDNALDTSALKMTQVWLPPDFIFNWTSIGQKYHKSLKYIHEFTQNVLNKAKKELQNETENQPLKNLMGLLLGTTDGDVKFTDKEIRDEVATVIAADKVYAEGREIFGECHSEMLNITLQDINRMEYLDRVFKETMRFFPAALVVGRYLTGDIVDLGEYILSAGSSVIIGIGEVHRSEEHWPNATEFNPDRFLPNHPLGPRHPYAFIPFTVGARSCIGMRYAMISAKTFISTVVSRYIIKTNSFREAKDVEVNMNISAKPKYPIMVSIERRLVESS